MPQSHPIYALLSHPGRIRKHNEDAGDVATGPGIEAFVVCDGMGGAAAGELASRIASQAFLSTITVSSSTLHSPKARINSAIQASNQAVYQHSRQSPELAGMGTTLVALVYLESLEHLEPPALWLANLGDSRCYLHRESRLTQLTTDHSFVEEQVRAGQLTPDQAATSPMRNLITRAIGSKSLADPDILALQPQSGDLYLLASDGLTRELSDTEISSILRTLPHPPTEAALSHTCQRIIDAANDRGGNDNITVLLVAFPAKLSSPAHSPNEPG